jgi:hypothetical protein
MRKTRFCAFPVGGSGLNRASLQIVYFRAVHLPESFRGVAPSAPDLGLVSPAQSVL